jgi:heme-degrading monooxygenase HmoA
LVISFSTRVLGSSTPDTPMVRARNHYTFGSIHRKPFVPYDFPMNNLITVVTRFPLPAGVTADQIRAAFDEAAPKFRNVPGLIRKQFLRSKDCRIAGGVYLWNDEHAARAFMNERVAPMIREKFHVDPAIEFYDSPVIVEN